MTEFWLFPALAMSFLAGFFALESPVKRDGFVTTLRHLVSPSLKTPAAHVRLYRVPVDDGDLLYPANKLAHTLIKQLTCHLNGTLISPQNDSYAYKAYLETVLNYSAQEGHTLLRPQGWFPTHHDMMTTGLDFPTPLTANKLDDATPHAHYTALSRPKKAAVLFSDQEQVPYQGGAVRTLVFKPHSELFHLNKPLVPGVEIKLRFMFNSPDFFLNGVALHGRLTPQDLEMTFHLCQLTLSVPLYNTLDTARHSRREVAKYPTVRSEVRVFSHAANQLEFNEGNLYQGRIPDRLVVGLLHTLYYHGDVAYPPFSFQKFGLSHIEQLVRGEVYPASALELNHNNTHKDLEGYFRFLWPVKPGAKGRPAWWNRRCGEGRAVVPCSCLTTSPMAPPTAP